MTNPAEAEKYIQFQLEQMSARNEHHRFEEICYRVARRRVSNNVKLASGPVSAGGDQGRDVESYVTWLPEQLPHATGFVAGASHKPVVVACTVQKEDLGRKAKDDIKKVCEGKTSAPVDLALFCSVGTVPTGKQHEIQAWAREAYDVQVEFFDGLTLSTMLAEIDLVWVAQEYLALPSHMVPDFPGEEPTPAWYRNMLGRCRRGAIDMQSLGDLAQLRPGLRQATRDPDLHADLPEWLAYVAQFLDRHPHVSDEVAMRARYEIAVAHIRGMQSLTAVEPAIREFIQYAVTSASLSLLEDAQVLLLYMGGAAARGVDRETSTVTAEEIAALHGDLSRSVASLRAGTDAATYPVRNARLLTLEALMALHPAYERFAAPEVAGGGGPERADGEGPEEVLEQGAGGTADTESDTGASTGASLRLDADDDIGEEPLPAEWLVDANRAVTLLGELVDILPEVPAFPVEVLAMQFDLVAPALMDIEGYEKVRDGLDEAVAHLKGDSAAADKSRRRAMQFLKLGRPFDALAEFHTAKEKWWHGDTLQGSLLAMRMIARIYSSLGMTLAAKQYRLTAASLAVTSEDPDLHGMAADSFIEGMEAAYEQGAWLDASAFGQVAALARHALVADAFDYDTHPYALKILELYVSNCICAARRFWPGLESVVWTALGTSGWESRMNEVVNAVWEYWDDRDESQFLSSTDADFSGTPFFDAGPTRTITFAALDMRWYVTVENDQLAVLAAERFCAATQILLCELVDLDPILVPQDVRVTIRIGKPLGTEERVQVAPSNTGLECKIFLTPYSDGLDRETLDRETFTVLARMLFSMSMRSDEEVLALLDQAAGSGLLNKLHIGRSYDEVASLLDADHYRACWAAQVADRATAFVPQQVEDLAAPEGPGPRYDHDEALENVGRRYERVSDLYALTISRVLADERVRGLLERLRKEGWLDWHLICAVAGIATNYRANKLGYYSNGGVNRQAAFDLFNTKETAESIVVPLEAFNEDTYATILRVNAATIAAGFGLMPPTKTPNLDATVDVLRKRYGYGSDDVPHLDLLGPDVLDEQGCLQQMLIEELP